MRRVRYSGKYPKKPEHKYKELEPQKYVDVADKISSKGKTILNTHKPIFLKEILSLISTEKEIIFLDLTLGFGGHAGEVINKISPQSTYIGVDQDLEELEKTKSKLNQIEKVKKIFIHSNFRELQKNLELLNIKKIDYVLCDLGLSSMQIDMPAKGFSSKHDSPLDFRMDKTKGRPASEVLKNLKIEELVKILTEYGDEVFPYKFSKAIYDLSKEGKLNTTYDLKNIILKTHARIKNHPEDPNKTIKRIFQALRIFINDELNALIELFNQLPQFLRKDSQIIFLSFHSGEDRIVKKFLKSYLETGVLKEIYGPIIPSVEELKFNTRAKSAKLRHGIS